MRKIALILDRQLLAHNGKAADPGVVTAWTRDLLSRLGPIVPEHLEAAFVAAREEAAERRARGRFGQLSIDDVVRSYRRAPKPVDAVPFDPYCGYCREGHVLMIDPEGYEVQVPCACAAGEHQRGLLKIYEGRHNVEELLRRGWKLKTSPQRITQDEVMWLVARSERTRPVEALAELNALKAANDPLPQLSDEEIERARSIIKEKPNKRRTAG